MQPSLNLAFDIMMLAASCSLIAIYLKNKFAFRMAPTVVAISTVLTFLAGLSNTAIRDFKLHALTLFRVVVAFDSYSYTIDPTSMLAQISTLSILALVLTKIIRKIDWD